MTRVETLTLSTVKERNALDGTGYRHQLFGDELVSATELNRQSGKILDLARIRPVTITRNDDHFALVKREFVADLFAMAQQAHTMARVADAVLALNSGRGMTRDHPFGWISAFGLQDRTTLLTECATSFLVAQSGKASWDDFSNLVHEWEESAYATMSPEVQEAFAAAPDEVPLTPPPVLEGESEQ